MRTFSKLMNLAGFKEQIVLGKGTYGKVYKAQRISDGVSYAVKVVNLGSLNHREREDAVNEIRLMASFTSPFIVRFYEAFSDNKRLCIVTEYSRLGDLSHLIDRRRSQKRPLKEEMIWRYLIQVLQGLQVLHDRGVVHRDLKSANILLSAPDFVKIADLGISTVLRTRQLARTQIGTPLYIAPEIWKSRPYDHKCDMWSLGVLLYEMMTFAYPFNGRTQREISQKACIGYYISPRGYSNELLNLVRRLLQANPFMRPTTNELLGTLSIQKRIGFVQSFIEDGENEPEGALLLSPIKVPLNMSHVNLPRPAYGKKPNIVKPIDQRMHVKAGAHLRRPLAVISSPELQKICDRDWWSPNKIGGQENEPENIHVVEEPQSARPVMRPPPVIGNVHAKKQQWARVNPRFRPRL